jgi:predicted ATPase
MITRIEINGFKTFENFGLDLQPFAAIVGPNASGKSNLFDAIRLLSRLAQTDIGTALRELRGEPEELFRQTESGPAGEMKFAIEVVLPPRGTDAFGTEYEIKSRRIRYAVTLSRLDGKGAASDGIFVTYESCKPIAWTGERAQFLRDATLRLHYGKRKSDFITTVTNLDKPLAFEVRQDGPQKRGNPLRISGARASRTALSTIGTAEYPHVYALRDILAAIRFLEINPQAARRPSDRFVVRDLLPDAANLAAVLARLKDETAKPERPEGVIADISADLAALIPSVQSVKVENDPRTKDYAFHVATAEGDFSSRVISDGTLRLLALLAILDDPSRKGVLCFEEPENGVHEGRIPALVSLLRESAWKPEPSDGQHAEPVFQILVNSHSPALMQALDQKEIVAAEMVTAINRESGHRTSMTRMTNILAGDQLPLDEKDMTRARISTILRQPGHTA